MGDENRCGKGIRKRPKNKQKKIIIKSQRVEERKGEEKEKRKLRHDP
jgi:hypothetical protein